LAPVTPLPGGLGRVAIVARWKPVHLGHAAALRGLCARAREVLVGIGSANRYDVRNPWTAAETREMLQLVLAGQRNSTLLEIPDLDDGPRWRALVVERLGALDAFVTDNPYVAQLLRDDYTVVRPVTLVPPAERVPVTGTAVRAALARGNGWRELVPPEIARFLESRRLDERFRHEFGLQTLALAAPL
jgi:nicotinamide-nucleotide adenylyltransferase